MTDKALAQITVAQTALAEASRLLGLPVVEPPKPLPTPPENPAGPLPVATGPITPDTAFRAVGPIPFEIWDAALIKTPMHAESRAIWKAAGHYSAIILYLARVESTYGKSLNAAYNFLNLQRIDWNGRDAKRFADYSSFTACAEELVRRFSDPTYKPALPGVYMPRGKSIKEFYYRYSPPSENNTELLITNLVRDLNKWLRRTIPPVVEPVPPPTPTRDPVFGRVPPPKHLQRRLILNNTAWDNLGKRSIKGICLHRMLGTREGTYIYFGNEARGRALTDFGVGLGVVDQWNTVLDSINGIFRSPWANGPASDVEGDGVAWIDHYGVVGVNRDCVSIEIEGLRFDSPFLEEVYARITPDTPILPCGWPEDLFLDDAAMEIGDKDFARVCELVARLADLGEWRYDQWPLNPDGIHGLLSHHEIGPKACAGVSVLNRVGEIISVVGDTLKHWQIDSVVSGDTPPATVFTVVKPQG